MHKAWTVAAVEARGIHKTFDQEMLDARGQTIVLVSHDPDVASAATRIVRLRDGMTEVAAPAEQTT